ncbi:DUF6982 domain-containing protein, partial [Pyxidicoccus sp. 3LFB2]
WDSAPSAEAAPEELQPEWVTAGGRARGPRPAAAWSETPSEEISLADAPVEAAQAEWSDAPVEVEPESSWSDAPAQTDSPFGTPSQPWASEPEPEAPAPAWQSSSNAFGAQAQDLSAAEHDVDVAIDAPPSPIEEAVPVELEPVQEMTEIELVEESVEPPPPAYIPPPPPPAPVAAVMAAAPVVSAAMASPGVTASPRASSVSTPVVAAAPAPAANRIVTREPFFSQPAVVDSAPITSFVEGEHRVIIHTVEGQVKRGTIRDADLLDEVISLEQQSGYAPEQIPGKRVKAIFFMLTAGTRQPQAEGQKIRVTFNDGRQVAGFSQDFKGATPGFFVIPADQRTNTARIFIYRSSVQAVAEG